MAGGKVLELKTHAEWKAQLDAAKAAGKAVRVLGCV